MAVIRVSGNPGSGKTTICRRLVKELGYRYSYTGGIFREMGAERGLSIEEFYALVAGDPELEKSVDKRQEKLMLEQDDLVVEGRMAPFGKCSFKTINAKIAVSDEEGVRRQLLRGENSGKTFEEMLALSRERAANERSRYKTLYGIEDYLADEHFDIVFDTTHLGPERAYQKFLHLVRSLL